MASSRDHDHPLNHGFANQALGRTGAFDFNQPPSLIMSNNITGETAQALENAMRTSAPPSSLDPSFVGSAAAVFAPPQVVQNPYGLPSPQTFSGSPILGEIPASGGVNEAASPSIQSLPSALASPSPSAAPETAEAGASRQKQPSKSDKKSGKAGVMMRVRRQERKTPAKPFIASEKMIAIVDTMSPAEMEAARDHNIRMAAEKKEHERHRNNQSAKRARIRKMATAVSLGDEIDRLRTAAARVRAEADMWKDIAYSRDIATNFPSLPSQDSVWAKEPLGPPPQNQHALEDHYEDEVKDMRRCLEAYVRTRELVGICSQEFHDEISHVLHRGAEIREGVDASHFVPLPMPENGMGTFPRANFEGSSFNMETDPVLSTLTTN